MDDLRTTSPSLSFRPEGSLPKWSAPHQIRHAALPSENVCTENLTPFLKLLPCKSLSGIASLLNPHRLFDADWHGMGVHVLWREEQGVELRLTFLSVFDPLRSTVGNKQGDLYSLQRFVVTQENYKIGRSNRFSIGLLIMLAPLQKQARSSFHCLRTPFTLSNPNLRN